MTSATSRLHTTLRQAHERMGYSPESPDLLRMLDVMDTLPTQSLDRFGFEVELGKPRDGMDLIFSLDPDGEAVHSIATSHAPIYTQPGWSDLQRVAQLCCDSESTIAGWVDLVWLEHDTRHAQDAVAAPNLFFTLHDYSWVDQDNRVVAHWIVEHAIGALTGGAPPKALADAVRTICQGLHAWGQVHQLGAMIARGTAAVRLVQSLPQQPLTRDVFCQAVSPLDGAHLHDLYAGLADIFDRFSLQLAVGSGGLECAWIECSMQCEVDAGGSRDDPTVWSRALAALCRRRLLDDAGCSRLERWLSSPRLPGISFDCAYLKFGLEHSSPRAKAYLACRQTKSHAGV